LLALAVAPDGTAWSVEESGILRQWNIDTGEVLRKDILSELEVVWTFNNQASLVASGSNDLCVWSTTSGQLLGTLGQKSWITAQAFRPDGRWLATGHDDGRVRGWDLASGRQGQELLAHGKPISAVAFSPDGRRLAVAAEDKTISLWDASTGRRLGELIGHKDRIAALAWHPSGKSLVSAAWDTTARVWNTETLEPIILLNAHGEVVSALAFSPDGRLLASADDNHVVWIWDAIAHRPMHVLGGHADAINSLAFHPDGKRLLSGGREHRLLCWEVADGRRLVEGSDQPIEAARISVHPSGRTLACAAGGKTVRLWSTQASAGDLQVEHSNVQAVAFSPDGRRLATGDALGRVCLWPATEFGVDRSRLRTPDSALQTLETNGSGITALDFSTDGRLLAAADGLGGCVYLWSMESFEPVLLIPEATERGTVEAVCFVPGGNLIAVAGLDWLSTAGAEGLICLWDVVQRRKFAAIACDATRLAVRPDGRELAANTGSGSIAIYDLTSLAFQREVLSQGADVRSLAYDPAGRLLAGGGDDGTLRLWDADSGSLAGAVELDTPIKDLAFSQDGQRLFTANANLTCYVLDVAMIAASPQAFKLT
jgi:WD40 repeat protein